MQSKDLSTVHGLITELFTIPDKKRLKEYELTSEQVAYFNENGYLAGVKMLEDEQINYLTWHLCSSFLFLPGWPDKQHLTIPVLLRLPQEK